MRQVSNGTLALRDVMRGVQLAISFPKAPSPAGFANFDENGAIPEGKEGGFMIEVLVSFCLSARCCRIPFAPCFSRF